MDASPEPFKESRAENKGWVNLKRPLDINTVVTLVGFIIGGLFFVARVDARFEAFNEQFRDFKIDTRSNLATLTSRIDAVMSEKGR